jgi:hypothetical protein
MSGLAHPPHDFADGDDCLAADSFAPPHLDGHWRDASHVGAALAEPELDACAISGPAAVRALEPDDWEAYPPADGRPETGLASGAEDDLQGDPLDKSEAGGPPDTDAADAAKAAGIRLPRVADNEFLPGGACALPELRVLPPPVALDRDARPVPDAAPERAPRRRRLRAWTCGGLAVVAAELALSLWNAPPPEILVRDVAAARGIHPDDFVRIAEIESRLDPRAYNRLSKASGLFQLLPGTAKQYKVADSFDARANAEAAARLLKHNAARLKKALGREPTAWELYLAHQQGAGGAIKLLKNPDKKAIEVVGRLPVLWNRGTEEMTAKQFATMWRDAFNGKKPAAVVN